ncbi:N-acetyllactosaminide 3-alpha-galactosyltransferase [Cooperia oncophora]
MHEAREAAPRIAVIIPYRDRQSHLRILLNNMHRFLTKQKLDYSIIVVEQIENQTFNRAKLLNVGFMEANKIYKWQCYLFHDVDLLPEDDRNLHTCPTNNPRHMAVAVNKFDYKLHYEEMFGMSSALTLDQFKKRMDFQIDTGDGVAKMTTCIRGRNATAIQQTNLKFI